RRRSGPRDSMCPPRPAWRQPRPALARPARRPRPAAPPARPATGHVLEDASGSFLSSAAAGDGRRVPAKAAGPGLAAAGQDDPAPAGLAGPTLGLAASPARRTRELAQPPARAAVRASWTAAACLILVCVPG